MADRRIKVFVVDNSEIWRRILIQQVLNVPEIEIVGETGSGQAAIMMLDEVDPDVVIMEASEDNKVPSVDVIRQLHKVKPEVHVILSVDSARKDFIVNAAGEEKVDFITKPYKKQIVLRTINENVENDFFE